MNLTARDEENGVTVVKLAGRMDIAGATAIDMQFSVLAGSKKKIVVDMADVDFMASLGMRTLVMAAKTVANKNGKMVLFQPQPNVEKVLKASAIDTVIPIAHDMPSAVAAVS